MRHRRNHRSKRKPPRIRRLTSPGASPGTLSIPTDAKRSKIRVIKYSADAFVERELKNTSALKEYLDDRSTTWISVEGLGDEEALQQIATLFDLHRLAMEDVVNVHQRAKADEYGDCLFVVVREVIPDDPMHTEQLSMFLGKNFVLTFQEKHSDTLEPVRTRLRESRGRIRSVGSDYLAYALIDAVIDAYFPAADQCGEQLELLDDKVAVDNTAQVMSALHSIRGDLVLLHRSIRPLRDALIMLLQDSHAFFSEATRPYLRDCFDHTVQILDLLDTYRDMCGDLRDFHFSAVSNRMNEVMKVLTIIATIFIPLSFVAGLYGMNFATSSPWNMPELNWRFGYPVVLVLMAGIAGSMLYFFWRRGWLRSTSALPRPPATGQQDSSDA